MVVGAGVAVCAPTAAVGRVCAVRLLAVAAEFLIRRVILVGVMAIITSVVSLPSLKADARALILELIELCAPHRVRARLRVASGLAFFVEAT